MSLAFGIYAPSGFATDPAALARAAAWLMRRRPPRGVDEGAVERWQRFGGTDDARLAAIARMAAHDRRGRGAGGARRLRLDTAPRSDRLPAHWPPTQALARPFGLHGVPARSTRARRHDDVRGTDGGLRLRRAGAVRVHARALPRAARIARARVRLHARRPRPRRERSVVGRQPGDVRDAVRHAAFSARRWRHPVPRRRRRASVSHRADALPAALRRRARAPARGAAGRVHRLQPQRERRRLRLCGDGRAAPRCLRRSALHRAPVRARSATR